MSLRQVQRDKAENRKGIATRSQQTLLSVSRLNAWYGGAHILHDVNLRVERGEVVALMGRNGMGKSTTIKAIMGLIARRSGHIEFMGRAVDKRQPYEIARLGLGYVPEERRIFTDLTIKENLETGRQPARAPSQGVAPLNWSVEELYKLFPNLGTMENRLASAMSGGEQQMLSMARTLMGNPYMVLLDEPSEGLAPVIVEQMAGMILSLKRQGCSVLLCEQNIHFASLVSDRAYVLERGVVRFEGTMGELAADEEVRGKYLAI